LRDDLVLAHRLADLAYSVAMPLFRAGVPHRRKRDGSPVSEADLAVEAAQLAELALSRPADGVLSEEFGELPGRSGRRWILDPIDGTASFLAGGRSWGTHVALEVDGELVLGVLSRPTERCRWWAAAGEGAYRSDDADVLRTARRLTVSSADLLRQARVGGLVMPGPAAAALARVATWLDDEVSVIGALLEGRLDAVLDDAGRLWDQAPAVVLVREAGGCFQDSAGGRRADTGWGVYSSMGLADELATVLRPHRPGSSAPVGLRLPR
jgi:histidinol-phosphatase